MDQQMPDSGNSIQPAQSAPERRTISDRKLAANRRNAQRSTGPRTARGKAHSAMNSSKHGILAHGPLAHGLVIPKLEGKRAALQFGAMMIALAADRKPVGALEALMVQEIGVCAWRLRRLLKYENRAAFLTSRNWSQPSSTWDSMDIALRGPDRVDYEHRGERILATTGLNGLSLPDADEVTTISRYENGLMRHLFRAIDQLERMQRSRRAADPEREAEKSDRTHAPEEISVQM